jgi:hypothetical protein
MVVGVFAVTPPEQRPRGPELLLEHCDQMDRLQSEPHSPRPRVETALGGRLTRVLLFALAPARSPGRYLRRRRGSSSP